MGRPRTPTNVLQLKGAFAKNPARGREREGEMEAIGELGAPPDWLTESERGAWEELRGMQPSGCAGTSDRAHMAMVSKLYAFCKVTPVEDIPPAILARLMAGLGLMGMNPSDRSKVKVGTAPVKNAFEDL